MKHIFSEDDCQKAQTKYLTDRRNMVRDLMFCAIPNAAKRGPKLAAIMKATGLVAGAPDLIVWMRGRVIQIENKIKGNPLSDTQKAFRDGLTALGHEYHVITSETPAAAVNQLIGILDA